MALRALRRVSGNCSEDTKMTRKSRARDVALILRMSDVVLASLNPLLDDATLDERKNKALFALFQKLDLLTTVTFVPWSKFPYHRDTLKFSQDVLRHEQQRSLVASVVAENIVMLLVREMSDQSEALLLLRLDSAYLKHCLDKFYVNELTGDAVAHEMVSHTVESIMAAHPVDAIISTIRDK